MEDVVINGKFDAGLIADALRPVLGMESPLGYRNKVQLPVGEGPDGKLTAGYYAQRSHRIVACENCLLDNDETFARVRNAVLAFCEENGVRAYDEVSGKGLLRHILIRHAHNSGQVMVCMIVREYPFRRCEALVRKLTETYPRVRSVTAIVNSL